MTKRSSALKLIKRLHEKGYEAYFVGGCVRDMLLGKNPKDFDIATNAVPDVVQKIFPRTVGVGAQFGVIVVIEDDQNFEVATFRADTGYQDGRRPTSVRFTAAKEDAIRRDFTVNGLFYDPIKKQVLDWVDGQKDLKKKVIRAIGNPQKRFEEDKLRMLRAIRFTANLGFHLETKTFAAIKKLAKQIHVVSAERIRDEVVKMMTGSNPALALELMDKSGLLIEILPEVSGMKGCKQPKQFHPEGDVFVHTKLLLKQLKDAPVVLAMGCLLHDIGKPKTYTKTDRIRFNGHDKVGAKMAEDILIRLRFSNELKEQIVACVDGHMRFKDVRVMRESTLKKFMQRPTFDTELIQHKIDCLASHGDIKNYNFLKKKIKEFGKEQIKPEPLLGGKDILALGYKPGPVIGKILSAVEEAQLERKISTKEEALALVQDPLFRQKLESKG